MVQHARDLLEADLAPGLEPDQPDDDLTDVKQDVLSNAFESFPGTPSEHGIRTKNPFFKLERLYGQGGRTLIGGNPAKRIGNNTYVIDRGQSAEGERTLALRLHSTDVAVVDIHKAVYNTGGWETRTTADRIACVLTGDWGIFTLKNRWYWYNFSSGLGRHESEFLIKFTDGDWIESASGTLHVNGDIVPRIRNRRRKKTLPEGQTAGVYADLTGKAPVYYVKCSKCGTVDGNFKSKREAEQHSVCGSCLHDERQALLKRLERDGKPKAKSRIESAVNRLLEDDFDAKADVMAHRPSWADHLRIQLQERTGNSFDYAIANDSVEPESRVFLVVRTTRAPAYVLYRDTAALHDDVFNSAYDRLVEAPEEMAADFILRYVDFDRLIALLRMDDHTAHLNTREDVIEYYNDVYGDAAVENMLRSVPLSRASIEAAANAIAAGDSDDMVYWLSSEGRADVTGADGSVAIQYHILPQTVQDAFEQDDPEEPDES